MLLADLVLTSSQEIFEYSIVKNNRFIVIILLAEIHIKLV